jgi:hypothetical protein
VIVSSTQRVGNGSPIGTNAFVTPAFGAPTAPAAFAAAPAFGVAMRGSKGCGE